MESSLSLCSNKLTLTEPCLFAVYSGRRLQMGSRLLVQGPKGGGGGRGQRKAEWQSGEILLDDGTQH